MIKKRNVNNNINSHNKDTQSFINLIEIYLKMVNLNENQILYKQLLCLV
jgi:hypothetical protein